MTTRAGLRTEVKNRLKEAGGVIWTDTELNGYIGKAILGLYPTYYLQKVATTTAGAGPVQTLPAGAKNLHFVGQLRVASTRTRKVRGWTEGQAQAVIPKVGITGDTLVWAWTTGFTEPTDDVTTLDLVPQAEEVVILRTMISAIERILADRVDSEKFYSLATRQGVTEDDLNHTLDALHASVDMRTRNAVPLPQVQV